MTDHGLKLDAGEVDAGDAAVLVVRHGVVHALQLREHLFGVFRGLQHPSAVTLVRVEGGARLLAVLFGVGFQQDVVKVAAAEMPRPFRCQDLDLVTRHFENGRVQRATAEVEDQHAALHALRVRVIHRRRRGLVHEAFHRHAGHFRRRDRALAGQFIKVRRHGDDHFSDVTADLGAVTLQLGKDERGNLRRGPFFAVDVHQMLRIVHVALDLENRAIRLPAVTRRAADELHILVRVEEDDGGRQALAVRVGHDFGIAIGFEVSQPGKGGAKVDSNVFSHKVEEWWVKGMIRE